MSLWRSKRRYDRGQRISDKADDALYAISLIQSEGSITTSRLDDLREDLRSGIHVLEQVLTALEHPESADSYTHAIALQYADHFGDIPKYGVERLEEHILVLDKLTRDFSKQPDLEGVIEGLEVIEETAARTTDREARRMRDRVSHSDY